MKLRLSTGGVIRISKQRWEQFLERLEWIKANGPR
jgi:hypothetical protein